MVPWRQYEWQKHCLIVPVGGDGNWHAVIYAPGTEEQRTLFNKNGLPVWNKKGTDTVTYAFSWWDTEEEALNALAKANKPD